MADELANVLAYLRTLSPSENPYVAFGDWLQQRALPRIAPSFATHVRVNLGLMAGRACSCRRTS